MSEDFPPAPTKTFTRLELAKLSGFAPKKIDAFVRAGMPVIRNAERKEALRFDLKAVFEWLAANREKPAVDELAQERQRKVRLENEKLEHEAKIRSGEFGPLNEIRAEVAEGVEQIRRHFLSVPARMTDLSDDQRAQVHADMVQAINAFANRMTEKIGADNAVA